MDELLNTFENTAEENAPAVDNTAAQDTAAQNAAAQDTATQNTAPQSELVYCPACFRAVPRPAARKYASRIDISCNFKLFIDYLASI